MKNYFEIIRLTDILDINSRLHICLNKNVNIEFLSVYPEWKKTIEHFESRSFPEIYTFWKHMNRYFQIDWDAAKMKQMIIDNREFIRPCSPASYAVLTKNTAFLEAIFKGPFELSVKNEQGDNEFIDERNLVENINSIFQFAIEKGCSVLQRLILIFAQFKPTRLDVNITDQVHRSALSWACIEGNLEVIQLLCAHPSININIRDQTDYSPLELTLVSPFINESKRKQIVKTLCDHPEIEVSGAPLMACNLEGPTKKEICDIIELLIKPKTADLNSSTDMDGWTCLHHACFNQNVKLVEILCRHPNIDVNAKTKWGGETPLHKACQKENLQIIEILSRHPNIDVQARDSDGLTPYQISNRLQDRNAIQFFKDQRKRKFKNAKIEDKRTKLDQNQMVAFTDK